MKKNHYLKELSIPQTQKRGGGNTKKEVRKIQEWLSLFESNNTGSGTATAIDGDFGPATQLAVKRYQEAVGLSPSGIVSRTLFKKLSEPIELAFEMPSNESLLRDKIATIALNHLLQSPQELQVGNETNLGPWVRSYMDGKNGSNWLWCVGFVQTIIDQAISELGGNLTKYMPATYSCDTLGNHANSYGNLIRLATWRKNPQLAKKGDLFLSRKSYNDWTHVGIILNATDEVIETVEGNTNDDGSRNGYGVFRRIRNYKKSNLDLISIDNITLDLNPI